MCLIFHTLLLLKGCEEKYLPGGGDLSGGWFWSPGAWFGGAFLDGGWTVKSRDNPAL